MADDHDHDHEHNNYHPPKRPQLVHSKEPSLAVQQATEWFRDFLQRCEDWGPPKMMACVAVWHNGKQDAESGHSYTTTRYSGCSEIPITMVPLFAAEHLRMHIMRDMAGPGMQNPMTGQQPPTDDEPPT